MYHLQVHVHTKSNKVKDLTVQPNEYRAKKIQQVNPACQKKTA